MNITSASATRVIANVAGTRDYRVELVFEEEVMISASCNCPYDWGGHCKHIVATLLAIDDGEAEIEQMMQSSSERQQCLDRLLKSVDTEDLRSFLGREVERIPEMGERFMACFSRAGYGRSPDDYKDEVESLLDLASDHGFIPYGEVVDFGPLKDLAEIYIQKGDFLEAAKIYQAIFETLEEKMDEIDDSDDNYGSEFDDCLQAFPDCINRSELGAGEKRKYIQYLFAKYLESDYFSDEYRDALDKLCTSDEDLEYWRELLTPQIPAQGPGEVDSYKRYQVQELISMQIHVLSRLKESHEELYALLDVSYQFNDKICLMYARQLLKDGDRQKAMEVAEEGLALFPYYALKELREFLCEIYREEDPQKYRETLLALFILSREWMYYEGLKMASSSDEWGGLFQRMLDHFTQERQGSDILIEIYLREMMYDQALQAVLGQNDLHTLRRYHSSLASLYPEQYFGAYQELIFPFAGKDTGRRHYRVVGDRGL